LTISHMDVNISGTEDIKIQEEYKKNVSANYELSKEQLISSLFTAFNGEIEINRLNGTELVSDNTTFNKIRNIVIGRIEGDEGYMVEKGYSGNFVILQWCDWDCTKSTKDFGTEFDKRKKKKKHLLLLPVEYVNNEDVFKEIVNLDVPIGLLGIRISEMSISEQYYQQQILRRYLKWKEDNK